MRLPLRAFVVTLAVLAPGIVAAASSTVEDRVSVSGNGSTLTGTNGGEGGALGWIHNFDTDSLLVLGAEHQRLGDAHWTFGSLAGALTREIGDGRYSFLAEAHEGAGEDGPHALHYRIEAAGVTGTYFHQLSILLEYRRIDVETTHGHLPKIGVSYLWTPHWLTSVSFTESAGGNVGTRLTSVRLDHYSPVVNLLAGGVYGQASPTIIDLGIVSPGHILREGYVGASRTFAHRTDVTLTADYLNLSGSKRATLTLSAIIRLGSLGARH
jgi:hypothetical protein